jgi:hypothetical protein
MFSPYSSNNLLELRLKLITSKIVESVKIKVQCARPDRTATVGTSSGYATILATPRKPSRMKRNCNGLRPLLEEMEGQPGIPDV